MSPILAEQIRKCIQGGVKTSSAIAQNLGIGSNACRYALQQLMEAGRIVSRGRRMLKTGKKVKTYSIGDWSKPLKPSGDELDKEILSLLAESPKSVTELCAHFPMLSERGVRGSIGRLKRRNVIGISSFVKDKDERRMALYALACDSAPLEVLRATKETPQFLAFVESARLYDRLHGQIVRGRA